MYGKRGVDSRPFPRRRPDGTSSTGQMNTLRERDQTETVAAHPGEIETTAAVFDRDVNSIGGAAQYDDGAFSLGVAGHIAKRLLHDPVNAQRECLRQLRGNTAMHEARLHRAICGIFRAV